ncbi:hypothetical protein [Geomonas sp.]|uniref:hypothetical protein n=1 Tax=Geomonas sp. TaxID=2651584 RepID=UPI002B47926B|nr:hypothetical protein [Geomonas sp.]
MSGDSTSNQASVYGSKGIASASNKPGARDAAVSWTDSSGNLWLFGGEGRDQSGTRGEFNDLWKFDGTNWTWVSGDTVINQYGVYGTKGVPSVTNKPGARSCAISWVGKDGNLWLFGGVGYAGSGFRGLLNDLWKFDGTKWTWVSGDSSPDQLGIYGQRGVASPVNKPGGRLFAVSWVDAGGNLWLFSGWGLATTSAQYELNDLWKFDGTNWTWVSGDTVTNQFGVYGSKGVPSAGNKPGSRDGAASWTDSSGNFWLFGGFGYGGSGQSGYLNDLWKFNGAAWTWVSGDTTSNQSGVYGVKGVASIANKPGGRDDLVTWADRSGNLWLSGGAGYAAAGVFGELNDLWKFDGTKWTWVSGDSTINQGAVFGSKGVSSPTNKPGAVQSRVAWTDAQGNFWIFGGRYYVDWTNDPIGNDLWKFAP